MFINTIKAFMFLLLLNKTVWCQWEAYDKECNNCPRDKQGSYGGFMYGGVCCCIGCTTRPERIRDQYSISCKCAQPSSGSISGFKCQTGEICNQCDRSMIRWDFNAAAAYFNSAVFTKLCCVKPEGGCQHPAKWNGYQITLGSILNPVSSPSVAECEC